MDKRTPTILRALQRLLGPYRLAVLVGAAGLLATARATLQISLDSRANERAELEHAAIQRAGDLRRELDNVVHPLEALCAFIQAVPQLDQARFNAFASTILDRNPSVHVLAWAPRVDLENRDAFEQGDPSLGRPPFGILELDGTGARVSATTRPSYYPVLFAAPQPLNQRLLGFDLASQPEWRNAMDRALERHAAAATGKVTLLDSDASGGLVLLLPAAQPGDREEVEGFAIAALDLETLASIGRRDEEHDRALSIEIVDRSAPAASSLVYRGGASTAQRRYVMSEIVEFGGRQLEVRTFTYGVPRASPVLALLTFALGMFVTALMVAYSSVVLGRKATVEREVTLRTRELAEARDSAERDAKEVAGLNRTLLQRNRELDELLFVTSHDLQEPARKISFFLDLLSKGLSEDVRLGAARELSGMERANERLRALLRDLQALSALGRSEVTILPIESELCANSAINDCADLIQRTGAVVQVDELPPVLANATLLHLVFFHLVQNALKFGRPETPPHIHITAHRAGTEWVFGVRDDGPGIELRNAEVVFAPFKRLNTSKENTGTGIGLSLCKKAVERLGGRIWVEAAPGGGAHVRFTVPSPTQADPGR